MTLEHIYDEVQQIFPDIGRTKILQDVNEVQKEFCRRSQILTSTSNETIVADTVVYNLPSACGALSSVIFKDSDGAILLGTDTLQYEVNQGTITFKSYYNLTITEIPSGISTISYYYVKIPTALVEPATSGSLVSGTEYTINKYISSDSFTNVGASSNATDVTFTSTGTTPTTWSNLSVLSATNTYTPELDSEFHQALVDGLFKKYFPIYPSLDRVLQGGDTMKVRDFQAGREALLRWENYIGQAKKYAYLARDKTRISTIYSDFIH
tara:strand:+ start:8928 stop:9728 length:801 start_codon:yes stop_codon:yes gene_type:complete